MNFKIENSKLIFRKLKISDYYEFNKLFFLCFGRKVSLEFFKMRYFNDRFSFCYGAFSKSKLIANVGMISIKLNNNDKERIFSRHSSMVLNEYRGYGVYSNLLEKVKMIIITKHRLVAMWPNKNNFSNFGIDKNKLINRKYYIYKTFLKKPTRTKINNYPISKLSSLKSFIKINNSFFLKNFIYFKQRYLSYKSNEYIINKYEYNKLNSFFILKYNKDFSGLSYVVMDHFGSEKIKKKHLNYLISNQDKLIFLSKEKLKNPNVKLLNKLNFKLGILRNFNLEQKKELMKKKEIYLGDTDIFISL